MRSRLAAEMRRRRNLTPEEAKREINTQRKETERRVKIDKENGPHFTKIHCVVGEWHWKVDGENVAVLDLRIFPSHSEDRDKNGNRIVEWMVPPTKVNDDGKTQRQFVGGVPYLEAEIHNMNTIRKFRKKGIMGKLLDKLKNDPKMRRIRTNFHDSTEYSREYLQRRGFKRKGDDLVWVDEKKYLADARETYFKRDVEDAARKSAAK